MRRPRSSVERAEGSFTMRERFSLTGREATRPADHASVPNAHQIRSTRVRAAPASRTPSVPALERALAILELVASSKSGLTFSQLARSLDFPKSSVHCLLLTFERHGYLQRDEATGRYMSGLKLVSIANMAIDGIVLRERAAPLLRALVANTGLTVHMAILDRGEVALIAKVDLPGVHRVATWVGKRMDVHCTSLGKCLIASLPEGDVDQIIRNKGLLRHNENTIVSLARLKEELVRTRRLGYALDDEEEEIGGRCIGAPVFNWDGSVVAAVSVTGSTRRIDTENCDTLADQVKQAAIGISRQLGYLGGCTPGAIR
ncbi:MAG: helix-turn-helix domain-containing protein [Luteitalea sp.]|nr:helix-turn-helix domain-containing protein [Luteitalea sp.]